MNHKKIIIISILLLVMSVATVSAGDFDDNYVTELSEVDDSLEIQNSDDLSASTGTFEELQAEINNAPAGSVLNLTRNYNGHEGAVVHLNKDLTIDGQGHTLNCLGEDCIAFYSNSGNIILKNLNIINGYSDYWNLIKLGGAIHIDGTAQYTIENCQFLDNFANGNGGAIYYDSTNPLIIDGCNFMRNVADDLGGSIYAHGGNLTIINTIFESNFADNSGGAIYSDSTTSINIKNCVFKSNLADDDDGGAIYLINANSVVEDSVFESNSANDYGGAIHTVGDRTISIRNCQFKSNTAKNDDGGAISTQDSYLIVDDSVFESNSADDNGGAIFHNSGYILNINNCVFNSNRAENNDGGAIYSAHNLKIANSTFKNNAAFEDGGAVKSNGAVDVDNCSFVGNNAFGAHFYDSNGGAIYSTDTVRIHFSEFIDNWASDYGGAIYAETVYINVNQHIEPSFNSIFHSNYVMDNSGGAISATNEVYAVNAEFNNNTAYGENGGAIYSPGKVDVNHCLFTNNNNEIFAYDYYKDLVFGDSGGAIFSEDEVIINNSTFSYNLALKDGGAIHAESVSLRNTPSYFISNHALKGHGGAIYTDKFNNDVKYAVFDGNRAGDFSNMDTYFADGDGGTIYIDGGNEITFSSCLFMNSWAYDEGGVIYLDSSSSKLSLIDNIFVNYVANDEGTAVFNCGEYGTVKNNWWGDDTILFKNILVEWHSLSSNEDHYDENPLAVKLILGSTNAGLNSRIPCYLSFVSLLDGSANHELFGLDYLHFKTGKKDYDGRFENYSYYSNGFGAFYIPYHLGVHEIYEDCYNNDGKLSGYINIIDNSADQDNESQVIQNNPLYFSHLQNMIDGASDGSVIALNNNFVYNQINDDEGIIINKNIVIDGQGHSLDAKSLSGIFQSSTGHITLKNIVFRNGNQVSADDGGAIRILGDARYTIINCTFDSNKALQDGGAIYNDGGNLELNDCTFINNRAEGANKLNDCDGGAVHSKAPLSINHCTFKNNYAADNGGAVYATDGITWVSTPSTFEGNTAYKGKGGAIYTNGFNNNVKYAVFFNNHAGEGATISDDGGAIYINSANTVTFSQCAFIINHCSDEGGAIYLDSTDSHLTLKNNYFLGNTADDEGKVVFNKGHYDAVTDNWWADNLPSNDNDLLIEWESIWANDHRTDSNPVYMKLKLTENICIVDNSVWATVCFYHYNDGSLCNGEMYTDLIGFLPKTDLEFYNRINYEYYVNILVKPLKSGLYDVSANLYGQFASATLSVYGYSQFANVPDEPIPPLFDENYAGIPDENNGNSVNTNVAKGNQVFNAGNTNILDLNNGVDNSTNNSSVSKVIDNPQTNSGDNNLWWIVLAILAVLAAGGIIIKYKS